MCFMRACCVGFFVNDIAPWLSHRITIAFFSFMYLNSFMSFVIHIASLVACVLAMYSASVVDKEIVGCHLLFQEMVPPPIMNTNLVVDLLSSRSPAQSASQYPTKSWGGNPPKCNFNYKVLCKYRKCAWSQSNVLGLDWSCVDSPCLLDMPNPAEYITWHTSKIP